MQGGFIGVLWYHPYLVSLLFACSAIPEFHNILSCYDMGCLFHWDCNEILPPYCRTEWPWDL